MSRQEKTIATEKEVVLKDGTIVCLCLPKLSDAEMLLKYINRISKEKTYITLQGDVLTLKEERAFLRNLIAQRKKNLSLHYIAKNKTKTKIVGITSLERLPRIHDHIANFGITISKEFRKKGLGKSMMEHLTQNAKSLFGKDVKIITLEVFATNTLAISLYKKFGFEIYGTLPKGARHKKEYVDMIQMYKSLNT